MATRLPHDDTAVVAVAATPPPASPTAAASAALTGHPDAEALAEATLLTVAGPDDVRHGVFSAKVAMSASATTRIGRPET